MSFRDLANTSALYQASLRDNYVHTLGLPVTCYVPVNENNKNELGDFIESNRKEIVVSILPRYKAYYQLISFLEEAVEDTLPLEALMKTSDDLPKDTIVQVSVTMPHNGELVNYWRVKSTGLKHLEVGYAKIVSLVPARNFSWEPK